MEFSFILTSRLNSALVVRARGRITDAKMILKVFLVFFIRLYNFATCGDPDERLPMAMEEEDYETLLNALEGNFGIIDKGNSRWLRTYRRIQTGRYAIRELQHPVTGEVSNNIVSITSISYIFCNRFTF